MHCVVEDTKGLCIVQNKKGTDMEVNVAQRRFYIWKLELWWIAFDAPQFYPEDRNHIKGNWFWRQ